MKKKCEVCGIGIGTSLWYDEKKKRWLKVEHMNKEVCIAYRENKKVELCEECFGDTKKAESVEAYFKQMVTI